MLWQEASSELKPIFKSILCKYLCLVTNSFSDAPYYLRSVPTYQDVCVYVYYLRSVPTYQDVCVYVYYLRSVLTYQDVCVYVCVSQEPLEIVYRNYRG